jgi:hypothetical protein
VISGQRNEDGGKRGKGNEEERRRKRVGGRGGKERWKRAFILGIGLVPEKSSHGIARTSALIYNDNWEALPCTLKRKDYLFIIFKVLIPSTSVLMVLGPPLSATNTIGILSLVEKWCSRAVRNL